MNFDIQMAYISEFKLMFNQLYKGSKLVHRAINSHAAHVRHPYLVIPKLASDTSES